MIVGTDLREPLEYGYVGDILKWEPHESGDGTINVFGVAADPTVDLDGQVCDPAWLRREMPEWFKYANVREQHSSIAAGRGVELTEDGDSWLLKSHVVDPGTITKVKNRVLTGYSIGVRRGEVLRGKSVGAPNGRIVGGKIVEVSLVDRPCNPNATIEIAKALSVDDEWTELEPVDGMIVKGAAEFAEAGAEGEDDSQPVDDAVDGGEDGEDDEDPLGLFDLDEDGDELDEGAAIEKGLIDSLLHGPKDDRKRDAHGRFGRGGASAGRAAARRKERERRLKEREAARKHHAAMDAEAAQDAQHAQRQGRSMEAGEHRAKLGHYDKAAEADGADDVELTSGLEYREARETMRTVDDILAGRIDKAARKVYDEHDDIEGAREVIAQIAELAISELEELATGRYDEFHDLSILMRAIEAMRQFHQREREQAGLPYDEDGDMMRHDFERIEMSVTRDPEPVPLKALDAPSEDLATLVQAEITKATGSLAETIEAQKAELAKLRAQVAEWGSKPIPSGVMINKSVMSSAPVRTETAAAGPQSPEYWDAKAAAPGLDPEVAASYRDKARELRRG